jgi:transcriptional regulator with XRE-family HTH domain
MPIPAISKRFGIAVRNRRMGLGISQEDLAEMAGIHPTYVGMIERGVRNATLDVASRLSKALKIEFPKLIAEAQAPRVRRGRKG